MIQVRKKNVTPEDVEHALTLVSEETNQAIQALTEFTDEEDAQILKQMELTMKSMFPNADKFELSPTDRQTNMPKLACTVDENPSSLTNLLHTDFILSSG